MIIRDADDLEDVLEAESVDMAILAVPVDAVHGVAERVVEAGVRGILNFAAAQLRVPPEVALKDVNLVMELEALSFALRRRDPER